MVPLALGAIAHERDSFVEDTARTAASIAGIAEARLGDHVTDDPALSAALVTAARQGDELLLLNTHGQCRRLPGASARTLPGVKLVAQSTQQNDPTTELTSNRVIAVQTVWDDGKLSGTAIGTVVLERPTGPLNQNIANLWLYLIGLSGAAMAAAVLIAIYFARWVSRPLARLDTAARKIADGDLTVRAKTRVRAAGAAPDGRHVQHDGRAARGPGARAPGDARRRLAPAPHPADRAAAPP